MAQVLGSKKSRSNMPTFNVRRLDTRLRPVDHSYEQDFVTARILWGDGFTQDSTPLSLRFFSTIPLAHGEKVVLSSDSNPGHPIEIYGKVSWCSEVQRESTKIISDQDFKYRVEIQYTHKDESSSEKVPDYAKTLTDLFNKGRKAK